MSSISTILFDLDGTLLDTEPDFTLILNHLLEQEHHKPVSSASVRRTVSSGARALVSLGFGITEEHSEFDSLLEKLLALYDKQISMTCCCVFPGVEKLLRSLEAAGKQWGIVTNKPSRFTLPLLERVPLLKDCTVVVSRDDVSQGKPSPDALLLACEKAEISPDEAIYVGDHPRDIEAGHRAGMDAIAVGWGYLPEGEPIEKWQADHVVGTPQELETLLTGPSGPCGKFGD